MGRSGTPDPPLSRDQVELLLKGLDDTDLQVRLTSLRALVKLALDVGTWMRVVSHIARTLRDATISETERQSYADCAGQVPMERVRDVLLRLAKEPDANLADLALSEAVPADVPSLEWSPSVEAPEPEGLDPDYGASPPDEPLDPDSPAAGDSLPAAPPPPSPAPAPPSSPAASPPGSAGPQQQQQQSQEQQIQYQQQQDEEEREPEQRTPKPSPQPQEPQYQSQEWQPRERTVSTGFARFDAPDDYVRNYTALATGTPYWYWFELGETAAQGRIEDAPSPIDISLLPDYALLTVVVFPFAESMELIGGAAGTLRLDPSGDATVEEQPAGAPAKAESLGSRLFFSIRTPRKPGRYGLRVSMYCQNVLVQSRSVAVHVAEHERGKWDALSATVDYTISNSLDFARIASRRPYRLSLMVNGADDGSHGFLFAAAGHDPFYCLASFTEGEIDADILAVRKALRMAAYGFTDDWIEGRKYLYEAPTTEQLSADLKALAVAGHRVYSSISRRLACQTESDLDAADRLMALMRTPGQVEIASRISPSMVLPAALLYDQPLDDGISLSRLRICPEFLKALESTTAGLEGHDCFQGRCQSQGDETIVCPGNFWGFRHALGLPVSVAAHKAGSYGKKAEEAASFIAYQAGLQFDIGFATGADLVERDAHLKWIETGLGVATSSASSRDEAFALFKTSRPHVFYFYCHGGLTSSNVPYLRIGGDDEDPITPTNVSDRVRWAATRPLVFINGCHTTALDPAQAIQFVTAFVENGHASGVIGTEITVFEPLATEFAEEFFSQVVVEQKSVGQAVRSARLALLKRKNPLGLAYVPFAAPDLAFKKVAGP